MCRDNLAGLRDVLAQGQKRGVLQRHIPSINGEFRIIIQWIVIRYSQLQWKGPLNYILSGYFWRTNACRGNLFILKYLQNHACVTLDINMSWIHLHIYLQLISVKKSSMDPFIAPDYTTQFIQRCNLIQRFIKKQ